MANAWTDHVSGIIREIHELPRPQLPEYTTSVRYFSWFKAMTLKWMSSFRSSNADFRDGINSIHDAIQSRLNGKSRRLNSFK